MDSDRIHCSTKDRNEAKRDVIDLSADVRQVRKLSDGTSLSWARRMESITSGCSHSKWFPKVPKCWWTGSITVLNNDQFQCTPMVFPFFLCQGQFWHHKKKKKKKKNSKNFTPGQWLKNFFWKKMNMQVQMIIRVQRARCLTDNLFVVLKHCKGFWYVPCVVPYVILFCLHQNNCCCLSF